MILTAYPTQPRRPHDAYPTPQAFVTAATRAMFGDPHTRKPRAVLDPGAGDGRWALALKAIFPQTLTVGVEIRDVPRPAGMDDWITGDFLTMPRMGPEGGFDAVVGNPPFAVAEEFVRLAHCYLDPAGRILFLLPLRFVASVKRARGLWREYPPAAVLVLSSRLSFDGSGRTDDTEYALFYWSPQKGYHVDCDFGIFDWKKPVPELVIFRPPNKGWIGGRG